MPARASSVSISARRLLLLGAVLLAWAAQANEFRFAQSRVRFEVPAGFTLVNQKEVERLYAPRRGPEYVIASAARTVAISYDHKPFDLSNVSLPLSLKVFEQVFEGRVHGLVWKERKLMELEKQSWLQLEFTSTERGTDFYNIMLVTPVKDRMLVLNFSSTLSEFPAAEAGLRASIQSVRLNIEIPDVAQPPAAKAKRSP